MALPSARLWQVTTRKHAHSPTPLWPWPRGPRRARRARAVPRRELGVARGGGGRPAGGVTAGRPTAPEPARRALRPPGRRGRAPRTSPARRRRPGGAASGAAAAGRGECTVRRERTWLVAGRTGARARRCCSTTSARRSCATARGRQALLHRHRRAVGLSEGAAGSPVQRPVSTTAGGPTSRPPPGVSRADTSRRRGVARAGRPRADAVDPRR